MAYDICDDILKQSGFERIGSLDYRIGLELWWNHAAKIHIIVFRFGSSCLLKGTKDYYLRSITEQGQTWARDVPAFYDYLENHFRELRIGFSFSRDVGLSLAQSHINERYFVDDASSVPHQKQIAQLDLEIQKKRTEVDGLKDLSALDTGSSSLLKSYLKQQTRELKKELENLHEESGRAKEKLSLLENLQQQYLSRSSASCLTFSLSSNIQVVRTPAELKDAVENIVKELADIHRYQITQKLCGGKLNIQATEASEPLFVWIEQWLGGSFSPRQIEKVDSAFRTLKESAGRQAMVIPDEDIIIDGQVREEKKLLASRAVSSLLDRLDIRDKINSPVKLTPQQMPICIGRLLEQGDSLGKVCEIPLVGLNHMYISGGTGAGKSYTGRVLIEEACQYPDLNILILDPRNQTVGLRVPEDRENIVSLYPEFNLPGNSARPFDFAYYAPASHFSERLPQDLSQLGRGRNIVSFKGLDDADRCELFSQILESVFDDYSGEESETLRGFLVIEEAQLFTKKRVGQDVKSAGQRAEMVLDKLVRECRKYGVCVIILSQSIKDFARESASIRQNTNTKVFLHNSDREVDYAADFIGDGRQIIRLQTAEAILYSPAFGTIKARIRPPFSKVWEFSETDTEKIIRGRQVSKITLSAEAQQLLSDIKGYHKTTDQVLNLSQLGTRFGIGSKRQVQQLVAELERQHMIRTRKLPERGHPRVIELISSDAD